MIGVLVNVLAVFPAYSQDGAATDPGREVPVDEEPENCYMLVDITSLKAQTSKWNTRNAQLHTQMTWRSSTDAGTHEIITATGIIVLVKQQGEDGQVVIVQKRLVCGEHKAPGLSPETKRKDDRGLSSGPRSTTPDECSKSDLLKKLGDAQMVSDLSAGFTVFGVVIGNGLEPGSCTDFAEVTFDVVIGANGVGSGEWSIDH